MDDSYKNTVPIHRTPVSNPLKNILKSRQLSSRSDLISLQRIKANWTTSNKDIQLESNFRNKSDKSFLIQMAKTHSKFSVNFSDKNIKRNKKKRQSKDSQKKITQEKDSEYIWTSQTKSEILRFSKKFKEDKKEDYDIDMRRSRKEKRIHEENIISNDSGLSIISNPSYARGWNKKKKRL